MTLIKRFPCRIAERLTGVARPCQIIMTEKGSAASRVSGGMPYDRCIARQTKKSRDEAGHARRERIEGAALA
ncbi:MAG: hypothetical protein KGM15_08965, partial [Pseudomonadota bacterium]|nr:hypothetical protein [Pseudomonadota bacterium]